jgi:hypothetical protein
MRKNVFLLGSIFSISRFIFTIYQINRPTVGPIGSGGISTLSWILVFFSLILGIIFLVLFITLSIKERNKNI